MTGLDAEVRDVVTLEVARVGRVAETGDPLRPFVLLDESGAEVRVVSEFLHHMLADDARPSSLRSYTYEEWLHGLGLHKLSGTIRYPKAA